MVAGEKGIHVIDPTPSSRRVVSLQDALSFSVRNNIWVGSKWSDPKVPDIGPTAIKAVVSAMADLLSASPESELAWRPPPNFHVKHAASPGRT